MMQIFMWNLEGGGNRGVMCARAMRTGCGVVSTYAFKPVRESEGNDLFQVVCELSSFLVGVLL